MLMEISVMRIKRKKSQSSAILIDTSSLAEMAPQRNAAQSQIPLTFSVPFHESRCKTPPIIPRPCRPAGCSLAPDRGFIIPSDAPCIYLVKANPSIQRQVIYREDMALVTSLLSASSFFLRSSDDESSISSWPMASLSACSIFSFWPRLSLSESVGSETISSTREMYDSSCCLASKRLLKASSLDLNFSASAILLELWS